MFPEFFVSTEATSTNLDTVLEDHTITILSA